MKKSTILHLSSILLLVASFVVNAQQAQRPSAPRASRQVAATPVPINTAFSIAFDHDGVITTHYRMFEKCGTAVESMYAELPVSALTNGTVTFPVKAKTTNGTCAYRVLARNAAPNVTPRESDSVTVSANIFTPVAPQPLPPGNVRIVITATIGANGTITNTQIESITVMK